MPLAPFEEPRFPPDCKPEGAGRGLLFAIRALRVVRSEGRSWASSRRYLLHRVLRFVGLGLPPLNAPSTPRH